MVIYNNSLIDDFQQDYSELNYPCFINFRLFKIIFIFYEQKIVPNMYTYFSQDHMINVFCFSTYDCDFSFKNNHIKVRVEN